MTMASIFLRRDIHDVCIIGSGFAGTFLALRLVEKGVRTVLIEAGGDLAPDAPREGRAELFPHAVTGTAAFPVDFNRTIGAGGTARKWNGVTSRFLPTDFHPRSTFGLFEDWPIRHEDLDPYYTQAEIATEARPGAKAILPGIEELAFAPLSFSERGPGRTPIRLVDAELPRFVASAHGTFIRDRPVTRLVLDDGGRITHVETRRPNGTVVNIRARHVVIAAGVVETVRLLMTSSSPAFPGGIGNGSGLLGRGLNIHPRFRTFIPREGSRILATGVHRSLAFIDSLRREGLGSVCVDLNFIEQNPAVDVTLEMEPALENRLRLDPQRKDAWGREVAVLNYHATEIDQRTLPRAKEIQQKLVSTLLKPGWKSTDGPDVWFHPAGGCRMGCDENAGVVDRDGLVFGTRNLYVAGASVFPSSGAANPTLTIVALALRMGDHLAARMGVKESSRSPC